MWFPPDWLFMTVAIVFLFFTLCGLGTLSDRIELRFMAPLDFVLTVITLVYYLHLCCFYESRAVYGCTLKNIITQSMVIYI